LKLFEIIVKDNTNPVTNIWESKIKVSVTKLKSNIIKLLFYIVLDIKITSIILTDF